MSKYSRFQKCLSLESLAVTIIGLLPMGVAYEYLPKNTVDKLEHKGFHHATRPLDVVIMLDASGSIDNTEWEYQLNFTKGVALKLAEHFREKNGTVRIGLGQFSNSEEVDLNLTADVTEHFHNYSTFNCQIPWDHHSADMCAGDPDEVACIEAPNCMVRKPGFTETGAGLCGPRPPDGVHRSSKTCVGGAAGTLFQNAPPLPSATGPCNDPVLSEPLKSILLVTDGKPMTSEMDPPGTLRGTLATRDAVEAARYIKNLTFYSDSQKVSIFGVMVRGEGSPSSNANDTLKALSSCCPMNRTMVHEHGWTNSAYCDGMEIADDCPHYLYVPDFSALIGKIEHVADQLADVATVPCQASSAVYV